MPKQKRKAIAKRIRFHSAWIALLMLIEAISSVWFAFDGILPVSSEVFALLGLAFALASIVGHWFYKDL
ncbi:hypothetical protein EOA64_00470 [Mesorhizobium sp. M1A.F.Ca.IN.022.02.1.1]|uniref:hypothetical protein n=1 Tax=unclassified Mesorhizobium TaxID=325217 RepID=UPI000FCAF537|nr:MULTISPECIES: hypothetical protein [unclassified Mesorhizobium]RUV65852.1 hypothetical protein EOA64_00470 [Mesorhizobium sp. M1A.F.Ca.IN.022.02.1.1]RWG26414.1 MAG: hypothetical protein EOQ60_27550 [Mesorhizobium sp.]TIS16473.1 MAG: hypothetical protein E5X10_07555 [Mesorhizobium sp.]